MTAADVLLWPLNHNLWLTDCHPRCTDREVCQYLPTVSLIICADADAPGLSHASCISHIPLRLLRIQECSAVATPRKPSSCSGADSGAENPFMEKVWCLMRPAACNVDTLSDSSSLRGNTRFNSLAGRQRNRQTESWVWIRADIIPHILNSLCRQRENCTVWTWKYCKSNRFLGEAWWKHLSDAWITVCKSWVGVRLYESGLQSCVVPSVFWRDGLKSALRVYHMSGARGASFRQRRAESAWSWTTTTQWDRFRL